MKCLLFAAVLMAAPTAPAGADVPRVTGIRAVCRNGQTFVTWKDAADGEAGAKFRYSLYRSDEPITRETLGRAELCYPGVPNNAAKLFGSAFTQKARQDAGTPAFPIWEGGKLVKKAMPTATIAEGGTPLPMFSGLAVRTVRKDGSSYYAVVATDTEFKPLGRIEPGESATTEAVTETVAPIQPIRIGDSKVRGRWARSTRITGKAALPLQLKLHGSQSRGGGASDHGDLYIYFGTPRMGWRDGLPGIFSVAEAHTNPRLILFIRDAIENPYGERPIETCWFGYRCVPVEAEHAEPRAYPFTENRVEWIVTWVTRRYKADPLRVTSAGQSMGGMGSTQFSFRHPELFAAVYPRLGRVRQTWLPAVGRKLRSLYKARWKKPAPMADGKSDYFERMDSLKWTAARHDDLPFYGWAFGKQDGVAPWSDQIEMVRILTANHHGFALAWTNGGHSSAGAAGMRTLVKYSPASKFALDRSYPAFGNSSIDSDMGNGDRNDGDPVGGINMGFGWDDVVDKPDKWSVKLSNDLATTEMTVDVTPRRCQRFKPKAAETVRWTHTAGGEGEATVDAWGLVTVEKVRITSGEPTVLTIRRQMQE